MHRLLRFARKDVRYELAIISDVHGQYIGEITTLTSDFKESDLAVPMIEKFLDKKTGK
jgi:hypothetical protein